MSKTKMNKPKTDDRARNYANLWRGVFVLALAFVLGSGTRLAAQQSTAIQPCTETQATKKTGPSTRVTTPSVTATGQTSIDETLPADRALEKLIEPYSARVRELATVIGKLQGELSRGGLGAGSLGNFVADGLRAQASKKLGQPVPVLITNAGGLRKSAIAAGDLRASDIFELLPFENALIQLDLTGEQLLKLLNVVLTRRDVQSGARITYRMNAEKNPEMVSVKLVDSGREVEIDPKGTYRLVTIDYLLGLRSGPYALLQEGKNVQPLGLTMRDAVLEYVKAETAAGRQIKATLDGRFVEEKSTKAEGQP
jgi:2',3'-cyclic-nucleotide 2'-phosphodiesterase (5'-nucleotidase family)